MKKDTLTFIVFVTVGIQSFAQEVDRNYLLGRFKQQEDNRFVKLEDQYAAGAARGQYLRREAYDAFKRMAEAARKENVELIIISATRNFEQQKAIWERKWDAEASIQNEADRAKKILLYSSMPGTSRHHWGTDMDLNNLENSYFESGEGLRIYTWLINHAGEFGFCQPYTSKENGRTGYEEEKWHWTYTPLSNEFLKTYKQSIRHTDIHGFKGADIAVTIEVIKLYVDGVSCK
jgi:LAS superfamily LD-carboxypeptidase LdcB